MERSIVKIKTKSVEKVNHKDKDNDKRKCQSQI